jgi:hypothetical protein
MKEKWLNKISELKARTQQIQFAQWDDLDIIKKQTKIFLDDAIEDTKEYDEELDDIKFKTIRFGTSSDEEEADWENGRRMLIAFLVKVEVIIKETVEDELPAQSPTSTSIPPSTGKYLLHILIALAGAIGLLILYFFWYKQNPELTDLIFYLILVLFGVAIAFLIYGLAGSAGQLNGEYMGVKFKFSGPIVAVILVVVGFFLLPRNSSVSQEVSFKVKLFHQNTALQTGEVKMFLDGGPTIEPVPVKDGQVTFANINRKYLDKPVTLTVRSDGFNDLKVDTLVAGKSSITLYPTKRGQVVITGFIMNPVKQGIPKAKIRVKQNGTGEGESVANGEYYVAISNVDTTLPIILEVTANVYGSTQEMVNAKSSGNSKNIIFGKAVNPNPTLKVGMSYQGGIIFQLDNDRRHGLIVSDKDQGVEAIWMIRPATLPEKYHSQKDGNSNSQNIIADQGAAGGYAALLCNRYTGGGYTDWYLPAINQLKTLYDNRAVVKNLQPGRYWSSTGNGPHAWSLDFTTRDMSVARVDERFLVRAIRSF